MVREHPFQAAVAARYGLRRESSTLFAIGGTIFLVLGLLLVVGAELQRARLERGLREGDRLGRELELLLLRLEEAGRRALREPEFAEVASTRMGEVFRRWNDTWTEQARETLREASLLEGLNRAVVLCGEWHAALARLAENHQIRVGEASRAYSDFHVGAVERSHQWQWMWSQGWAATRENWERGLVRSRWLAWAGVAFCALAGPILWHSGCARSNRPGWDYQERIQHLERGDWDSPWPAAGGAVWRTVSEAWARWVAGVRQNFQQARDGGMDLLALHSRWNRWLKRVEQREEQYRRLVTDCRRALDAMRQQSSLAAGSSSQEEVVPVRVGEAVQNVAAWVSDPASTAGQTWREPLESARLQLARMPHTLDTIQRAVSMVLKMADQSHLLSVNAAIEAEKAGEYGLGFAVVAGEVRRLADQTAVAAGEIEEALEELRLQAESGLKSFETLEAVFKRGERMEIPMTLSAFGALPAEPTWPQRPRAGSSAWDEVTDRCRNSLIEFCTSWQEAESLWDEAAQMLAELERMGRSLSELGPAWVGSSTLKRGTGHEPIG